MLPIMSSRQAEWLEFTIGFPNQSLVIDPPIARLHCYEPFRVRLRELQHYLRTGRLRTGCIHGLIQSSPDAALRPDPCRTKQGAPPGYSRGGGSVRQLSLVHPLRQMDQEQSRAERATLR